MLFCMVCTFFTLSAYLDSNDVFLFQVSSSLLFYAKKCLGCADIESFNTSVVIFGSCMYILVQRRREGKRVSS